MASSPDYYMCEWDQAARRRGETKVRPGSGVLDPGPPVTNTRPYSVPGGAGVLDPGPPSFNPKPFSLPGSGGVLSK